MSKSNVTSLSVFRASREAREADTATKVAAIVAEAAESVRRLRVACPDEVLEHANGTLDELADIVAEYERSLRVGCGR